MFRSSKYFQRKSSSKNCNLQELIWSIFSEFDSEHINMTHYDDDTNWKIELLWWVIGYENSIDHSEKIFTKQLIIKLKRLFQGHYLYLDWWASSVKTVSLFFDTEWLDVKWLIRINLRIYKHILWCVCRIRPSE